MKRTAIISIPKGLEKYWLTPRPGSLAARILAKDAEGARETARQAVDIVPKKPLARDAAPDDVKAWITVNGARIPVMKWQTKKEAVQSFVRKKGKPVGVNSGASKRRRTPFIDYRDRAAVRRAPYASPTDAALERGSWESVQNALEAANRGIVFGGASAGDRIMRRYPALQSRYDAIASRGKEIARDLEDAARASGGELYGKEFGVKGAASLERKIRDKIITMEKVGKIETPKSVFSKLTDIIRYTVMFDDNSLAENSERLIARFKKKGYNLIEVDNKWNDPKPYCGLHFLFSKNGATFEVQVHSPKGMAIKNKLHSLYEISRDKTRPREERDKADRKMAELAKGYVRPRCIEKFTNFKKRTVGLNREGRKTPWRKMKNGNIISMMSEL